MRPYDETIDVAPYVCYSIEQAAREIADEIQRLELIVKRKEPMYDLKKCSNAIEQLRRTTAQERYRERLSIFERFNRNGEPISTCNPASKWDWYVIGGRWDGWINDRKSSSNCLSDNSASTEDVLARSKLTHAIITPDGIWHERGRMGWWAILTNENEDWDVEAMQLFTQYPSHRVVLVDAHV
jgi:hypothetical protein